MSGDFADEPKHSALARVKSLHEAIAKSTASPRAFDNLGNDVNALLTRLECGAYEETDFEARALFDIPRRTREFFRYFAGYHAQAQAWAALLNGFSLGELTRVIDVCPGWAPKIEWALVLHGYVGEVVVYDKEEESLSALADFLEMLRPNYRLLTLCRDLSAPRKPTAPLVVANHLVDDLLLNDCAKRRGIDANSIYADERVYAELARSILKDAAHCRELARAWVNSLAEFVEKDGTIILTHYPSLTESFLNLPDWTAFCAGFLNGMKDEFEAMGFENVSAATARHLNDLPNPYFKSEHVIALKKK